MKSTDERGIALITALMVTLLMSALLVAFTTVVTSDQRFRFIDHARGQAFYAASGALEKLTADLGNTFFTNVAPTSSQVTSLTSALPSITGVSYTAPIAPSPLPASSLSTYYCVSPKTIKTVGGNGYAITFCADTAGNPISTLSAPVTSGPYQGLIALQTPYQLDVTAVTSTGGNVHLVRTMEAVAIPVFQFGMFSDVDLSFFAGPNFDFGGRVHTNGNLYLAEGGGATLTIRDKVTAVKEVIRQKLQNGVSIDTAATHDGTVKMATSPTTFRNLARTEGSVVDTASSALNEPTWHTISLSTYNSWIRNGRTGAKSLNLPLITAGGINPDLVRRPGTTTENVDNPVLFGERLFTKASLRVLLSDTAADITSIPTLTSTPPVLLDGDWFAVAPNNGTAYGPVNALHPPIARSPGPLSTTVAAGSTTSTINVASTALFRPALKLNGTAVICTGKDATHFTTCTVGMPATVAPVNVTAGPGLSVATTANSTALSTQITVGSTTAFNPAPFWVGGTLVTCTGYSATQFSGCAGLAAAPASGAVVTTSALSSAGTGLIGGYIKIEMQNTAGVWSDVTMELLNYGIGGPNLSGQVCADPTPNAILRLQRLRDNAGGTPATAGGGCSYNTDATGAKDATNWWPNTLFDTREGLQRDVNPGTSNVTLGGTMHHTVVDAANLARWFTGVAPYNTGSGASARKDNGGFTLYFSDRRNNRNGASLETSEFGWEDFVNPASATGAANGALDAGEDVNGNGTIETYGATPNYNGVAGAAVPGAVAPLTAAATPTTQVSPGQAMTNRAILFRRALKLTNGSTLGALVTGLTVVTENPVYIQGDWNASGAFNDPHAATSVIADAVTLLSNNWTDAISFQQPYAPGNRNRGVQTWYRVAVIAGKGPSFPQPSGTATDFGTDGGAHNFLRYLENGDQAVNYRGSLVTFYYSRQAVGTFKCCTTVYGAPTRNYAFDTDFLTPSLLPPNTPVFRDLNAVGFSQELRAGR